MRSLTKPVGSSPQSGQTGSSLLTKAGKLMLLSEGIPKFPLSEQEMEWVADLPGKLPTSPSHMVAILREEYPGA